ncbi:zinc metalloproteinase dpy-31-like [Haliotis rubra]|uniref:zinc metalloproteinase dpy-31-like n=1 Tax=Haliotis rubra TaxID=36100 RepID=UPI001EE5EF49|nr:zinc metalloproteinase dpy-31-like [Haliotis rubra]
MTAYVKQDIICDSCAKYPILRKILMLEMTADCFNYTMCKTHFVLDRTVKQDIICDSCAKYPILRKILMLEMTADCFNYTMCKTHFVLDRTARLNTKALRLATGKRIARPNIPPEEIGVDGAYESDMKLTPEQMMMLGNDDRPGGSRFRRKAVAQDQYLWPNNVVVYEFDSDLPSSYRDNIHRAIQHWEDLTCIRFKEYSTALHDDSRVKFYQGPGCQSAIGRIVGGQETSIGTRCNTVSLFAFITYISCVDTFKP